MTTLEAVFDRQNLRAADSQYIDILENLPAAIYATDADGVVTFFNRAAAELAGREPRIGKDRWCISWRLYRPDGTELPLDECPLARTLKGGQPVRGEEVIAERPDGTRVPLMPCPTPIFDRSGRLVGAVNMLVDNSERRNAVIQLEASEARYRGIFEGARVALWDEDFSAVLNLLDRLRAKGVRDVRAYFAERPRELAEAVTLVHVRDVNSYTVELFEAAEKSALLGALGANFVDATHAVFLDEMVALWDGKRRFESESLVRTLKGRMLTVLLTISWEGARCERSLVSIIDISKQKASEEAQRQLAMIVESSDDAIVSKDLDGTIMSWNAGAERLYGYTADEVIGKPVTILFPAGREDEEIRILDRIRRGEPIEHYDTVRRRKDGTFVDVSLTVSPVKDATGRIVGASKIARDISERKQTERALAKSVKEQATLYQFTDRLHRTQSASDVFEAAFDAIADGLGCERASILLLDRSGKMRFVAWRGLSAEYRQAVDGHSPWSPDVTYPSPLCIEDVEASDLPEELKAKIRSENIAALSFIPLMGASRLIGKFMTYYSEPHKFTEQELGLALTIARQLSFGVERTRGEEERRRFEESLLESEERLEMALNAGRMGAWEWNISTGRVVWSPGLERIHGLEPGSFDGTFDAFKRDMHPKDVGRVLVAIENAVKEAGEYHVAYRINHPNGSVRWLEASGRFMPGYDETEKRLVGICTDITERKEAEAQRDLLLAELSHRVKNTLATVISIARQSFSRNQNVEDVITSFDARIRALAQTHTRLAEASWSGVSFETMLNDELAPYRREDGGNLHVSGPPIRLSPRSALTLGMAIHELATNAAKHGALSSKKGAVDISWQLDPERQLHIRWAESGGPPVGPPERSGFGRLLLERALASDLRGDVRLDFAKSGLTCSIRLPLEDNGASFGQ